MARPRLKIDPKQVEALARISCTHEEIAAVLGCTTKTVQRRFVHLIERHRHGGKASLRRTQWKKALDGNTAMLIWLGKQHLGQTDRLDQRVSDPDGRPLVPTSVQVILVSPGHAQAHQLPAAPVRVIEAPAIEG